MSLRLTPRLLLLIAALLFSTGGTAIKATALSSWQVAGFRSGIAALALFALFRRWRRWWQPGTLAVGAAYAATMVFFVTGNKLTTAANTIFLQSTAPIYILLLGPLLLKERIRREDVVFTATLVMGMLMFFVGVQPPLVTAPHPFAGNLIAACSGLTWALTILGLRWLARDSRGGDRAGAAVVAGNVLVFVVCLPFAFPVQNSGSADWLIVGYLGLFQIGLAYICMTFAVRRLSALEASLLMLLEPVLSAVWAWLIHGERPGPWALAGCTIILVATLARAQRRQVR